MVLLCRETGTTEYSFGPAPRAPGRCRACLVGAAAIVVILAHPAAAQPGEPDLAPAIPRVPAEPPAPSASSPGVTTEAARAPVSPELGRRGVEIHGFLSEGGFLST